MRTIVKVTYSDGDEVITPINTSPQGAKDYFRVGGVDFAQTTDGREYKRTILAVEVLELHNLQSCLFKCTTPESLRSTIFCAVKCAGITDGETFAVLVEGNDLGEFYINVLNSREIAALVADGDSISGMKGYGYRFYNRIADADEIVNEFFTESKIEL